MHISTLCSVSLLAIAALAAPAPHVQHEKRSVSSQWFKGERVHEDVKLPVRIGLTQSNLDEGHDMLMDISDPKSSNFANYLSAEEIIDFFAPQDDTVAAVRSWLHSAGISEDRVSHSANKQWLQFDAKTSELEELVKADYHFFEHGPTGKVSIACDEYHLPSHISRHVDYITPGIKLYATGAKKPKREELEKRTQIGNGGSRKPIAPPTFPLPFTVQSIDPTDLTTCGTLVTPACIRAFYNITKGTKHAAGNELGIFENLGDYYAQQDLNQFFSKYYPAIPKGTHPKLEGIDGGVAPTTVENAGPESDLDFQISYPIIWPQNSILFQTDDPVYEANYTYEGFLNNFLDAIDGSYCTAEGGNSPLDPPYPDPQAGGYKGKLQCGVYKPTNVISISYGGQEADLSASYQQRQCREFMKLGMQGVSICISSGDTGVAGPTDDDNANGCLGHKGSIFSPAFPATCPYVTTLGATVLPPGASAAKDQETAVTRFPSGGGFSNIYPIPSYQKQAVQNYLTKYPPPYKSYSAVNNQGIGAKGGIYNRAGRGYPDFAAIGDNIATYNQGAPFLVGGTSASSPVFAAILTRINEERIAVGKKTIGFVNPTLYAHPEVLHDITKGNNPGCNTTGFAVQPGWDPVTGLGTPNYPAMLKLFLSLP